MALLLSSVVQAWAQKDSTAYPHVAPERYLMADRDAEIALARTGAPKSISDDAEVMVLDQHGYTTAVKGTNGFVCLVQRSWTAGVDAPEFWNPKVHAPGCFNAAAARSYLQIDIAKSELVMAGAETAAAVRVALEKKGVPAMEVGAMCYMMSKQGYLNDAAGHWHPHLMFFLPFTDAKEWGAELPGSPIFVGPDPHDKLTIFFVPVGKWSDGTADSGDQH